MSRLYADEFSRLGHAIQDRMNEVIEEIATKPLTQEDYRKQQGYIAALNFVSETMQRITGSPAAAKERRQSDPWQDQ